MIPPHAHLLATARFYKRNARRGERQKAWLANKAQIVTAHDAWLAISGLGPTMPVSPRRALKLAA